MKRTLFISLVIASSAVGVGCKKGVITGSNGVPTLVAESGSVGTLTQGATSATEADFTVDFGNIQVGQTGVMSLSLGDANVSPYVVSNQAGPTDPEFALAGVTQDLTVEGATPAVLQLTFKPFAAGMKADKIVLTTNAAPPLVVINVVGQGVKLDVTVVPQALDFGKVVVATKATLSVKVTNQSTTLPVTLSAFNLIASTDSALFTIESSSGNGADQVLAPGGAVTIPVDFTPVLPSTTDFHAAFNLHFCSGCPDKIVNLQGQGVTSALEIAPNPLDFGFVAVGKTRTLPVTVTNVANQNVTITNATVSSASGVFSVNAAFPQGTVTLAPGQVQAFPVDFLPVSAQHYTDGQLQLVTSDANHNPKVPLLGYGGGPQINCEPGALDFSTVAVGAPVTQVVYCTNVGTDVLDPANHPIAAAELQIPTGGLTVNGSPAFTAHLDAPNAGLTAGQTAAIDVVYAPLLAGMDQATLEITSNDSSASPTPVGLSGQAQVLPPCAYSLTPSQLSFGHVDLGHTATLGFTVTNTGTNACLVSGLNLSPTTDKSFTLKDYPTGAPSLTLGAPGGSQPSQLAVAVNFSPTQQGSFNGAVSFSISSPSAPQQTVTLSGTSAPGCLLIAPNNLDFGVVGFNPHSNRWCQSSARKINLYNTCNYDVILTSLTPTDAADFTTANLPSLPYDLMAGASTSITVDFTPQSTGVKYGSLGVQTGQLASPYLVAFRGNAQAGVDQVDTFVQAQAPKVDILFVLDTDDNGTVDTLVAQNLPAFMNFAIAQGIDYHIGVTTSDDCSIELGRLDPCPGCAVNGAAPLLVTPDMGQAGVTQLTSLINNIAKNAAGCSDDLFQPAYLALTAPNLTGYNAGFLRSDASLAVIGVDDGDDASPQSNDFYFNFFEGLKGFANSSQFSFSAVNNLPSDPSGGCGSGSNSIQYDGPTVRVPDMVSRTGGLGVDICTQNWGAALTQLGAIAFGSRSAFPLTATPADPTQIVVKNGTAVIPAVDPTRGLPNWTYSAATNAVVFDPAVVPLPGQTITVTYPVECQ